MRELENLVERMVNLCEGLLIDVEDLPAEMIAATPPLPAAPALRLEDSERAHILQAIEAHAGNLRRAANQLGLSRTTLYNKINRWRIDVRHFRQ